LQGKVGGEKVRGGLLRGSFLEKRVGGTDAGLSVGQRIHRNTGRQNRSLKGARKRSIKEGKGVRGYQKNIPVFERA